MQWLDIWRGLALLQMMMFHAAYDLSWIGWTTWRLNVDPGWGFWRAGIVAQFCLSAGVALARRPLDSTTASPWPPGFLRRITQIAAAALFISLISWLLFGPRWIQFGILHFFAVALPFTIAFEKCRVRWLPKVQAGMFWSLAGLMALVLGMGWQHPFFNPSPNYWLGFVTIRPLTEDYVPVFPWIGVVWLGYGWGRSGKPQPGLQRHAGTGFERATRWLSFLGRHGLSVYLLHQPIILLLLYGLFSVYRYASTGT